MQYPSRAEKFTFDLPNNPWRFRRYIITYTSFVVLRFFFQILSSPKVFTVPQVSCATNLRYIYYIVYIGAKLVGVKYRRLPTMAFSGKPCFPSNYPKVEPIQPVIVCVHFWQSFFSVTVRIRTGTLATQSSNEKQTS